MMDVVVQTAAGDPSLGNPGLQQQTVALRDFRHGTLPAPYKDSGELNLGMFAC